MTSPGPLDCAISYCEYTKRSMGSIPLTWGLLFILLANFRSDVSEDSCVRDEVCGLETGERGRSGLEAAANNDDANCQQSVTHRFLDKTINSELFFYNILMLPSFLAANLKKDIIVVVGVIHLDCRTQNFMFNS